MRSIQTTLYSVAAPLMLFVLPVMNFSIDQIGDYLRGDEFREFTGELLVQIISGPVEAIIRGLALLLFGATGG